MIKLTPYKAQTANYNFAHVTNPSFKGEKSQTKNKSDEIAGSLEALSAINEAKVLTNKAKRNEAEEFKQKWEELREALAEKSEEDAKFADEGMEFFLKTRKEAGEIREKSENLYKEAKSILEKAVSEDLDSHPEYEIKTEKDFCPSVNTRETLSLVDKETGKIFRVFGFLKNEEGILKPRWIYDVKYNGDKITADEYSYKENRDYCSYREGLIGREFKNGELGFCRPDISPKEIISDSGSFYDFEYWVNSSFGSDDDVEKYLRFEPASEGFELEYLINRSKGTPKKACKIDFSNGPKSASLKLEENGEEIYSSLNA